MRLSLLILSFSFVFAAHAEKMDIKTHDLLIQKLEKGQAYSPSKSQDIEIRLADLYADRSRLKQMALNEPNCKDCQHPKADQQVALSKYLRLFEVTKGVEQERILVQIIQLHMELKKQKSMKSFFEKILKKSKYPRPLKARAQMAIAEQTFYKGEYALALKQYNKSTGFSSKLLTPVTRYRMAWCRLNIGQVAQARIELLAVLSLIVKNNSDPSLQSDMARDLTPFFIKGKISKIEMNQLKSLSPKAEARENLLYLSDELGRHSRPEEMTAVNLYILNNFKANDLEKAELLIGVAQAQYMLEQKGKAGRTFVQALGVYQNQDCDDDEKCSLFAKRSRKFVISWNQDEKLKPTKRLLAQLNRYTQVFQKDVEVSYWAGQSAEKAKDWFAAQKFYTQAVNVLFDAEVGSAKSLNKLRSPSLQGAIRSAESSGLIPRKRQAYQLYLKHQAQGSRSFEVRYQLAYLDYVEKKNELAKKQFNQLVEDYRKTKKPANKSYAKKSADLVLDILAQGKESNKIISRSSEFGQVFSSGRKEYMSIYRKALLNKSSLALSQSPLDTGEVSDSLALMKRLSFRDVLESEQLSLLKVQNLLAEKVRNISEVQRTAQKILNFKKASIKDKMFAEKQLVWASEITLNFSKAYSLTQQQFGRGNKTKKQLLRLGLLAELSGRNPKAHYLDYLRKSTGTLEGNRIRAKIVRSSSSPWKEIRSMISSLKKSPQLFSELALETFFRYKNIKMAKKALASGSVSYKPAGKTLQHHVDIIEFKQLVRSLSRHIVSGRSDRRMQKGIAQRIQKLNGLETFTNKIIRRGDWSLQVSGLKVLKDENMRFHRDILNLPSPKGLSVVESGKYKQLIAEKASPYKQKSLTIASELERMWSQQSYVDTLAKNYETGSFVDQKIIATEAQFLSPFAPSDYRTSLMDLSGQPQYKNGRFKESSTCRKKETI